ncbi:MAG: formylmethanofuran dehydrogenase [Clostridiales bacterium]|nr:formylmethanofuran dehydrogenase [Clostridiales bacterium]
MQKELKSLWDTCVTFHGHACGGLTIGFQAARYAMELLELDFSADEDVVCITENDACGVDAIQALMSCTVGKGNLIFNLQGKNAFSFYRRSDGKSFRLVLRPTPDKTKGERLAWLMDGDFHEMFDVKEAPAPVPEEARIFKTVTCSVCGERFAESFARLQDGEIVCSACYRPYTRGL